MQIQYNGRPHDAGEGTTVAALLVELRLPPTHVAVEVNAEIVPRARHAEQILQAGDRVEVMTLVGGG